MHASSWSSRINYLKTRTQLLAPAVCEMQEREVDAAIPTELRLTRETFGAETFGTLEDFLCGDPAVHVYAIGDLDPACWPHCSWDGLREIPSVGPAVGVRHSVFGCTTVEDEAGAKGGGRLRAVALTYRGLSVPVLQLLAPPTKVKKVEAAKELMAQLVAAPERLPQGEWEAHLCMGFEHVRRQPWLDSQMTPAAVRCAMDATAGAYTAAVQAHG